MSMDDWELREEAAREEFEREIEERTLADIKENAINYYFFYYGDDIEGRIQRRIDAGKELVGKGFNGESLTSSVVAVELTIRWFLLRPLCEAAFMSEEVADILVRRILPPRATAVDREILPKVLRHWGSDLTSILLRDGSQLWQRLTSECIPARNLFIHRGEEVEQATAECAAEVAERLLGEAIRIVTPFKGRGKDGWAPEESRRKLDEM